MRDASCTLALVLLALCPTTVAGQTLSTLLKENETVIGMGAMSGATYVGINDSRTWLAEIDTSYPDSDQDGCLLSNGFVFLRERSPLYSPVGARLDEWISISLTKDGDVGMLLRARLANNADVDGAYWNLFKVAQEAELVQWPLPPIFPANGAPWTRFYVVKMTGDNQMFVLGELNTTVSSNRSERSLVRYRLDDQGSILETTVLATENMQIDIEPSGPTNNLTLNHMTCLGNNEHILSVNERGDFITLIQTASTSAFVINMTRIVAQVGKPWKPGESNWRQLALGRVAINDRGDWLVSGAIGEMTNPTGYLIVKNGEKFAQQGDLIPALSASRLAAGSNPPLVIANTGDVYWHARTANGTDDAFMRNYEPILQRGKLIDGTLVTQINGSENAFSVSPNGRFFVGNCTLQSPGTALVFADFGLVLELDGCTNKNEGTLKLQSGQARVGSQFTLAMDNGQAPGAVAAILFSRGLRNPVTGCGLVIPGIGEGMLAAPILSTMRLPDWSGTQPTTRTIGVPNRLSLVDLTFFGQGVFLSVGHPDEEIRLTNAVRIELGAP